MKTTIYRLFLVALFAVIVPFAARAGNFNNTLLRFSNPVFEIDSVPSKKPDKKPENKPSDKPEVKEVPKSKRQIKPSAVGDKVKGKSPVRVRPDIKKPVRNIKRGFGYI